jgi:hypothetical protein
MRLKVNN